VKVWVLTSLEFGGGSQVWEVYEDVESAKKDKDLPADLEWSHNPLHNNWRAYSDLTWNSYQLEEFEVK
jgi:hypothetical protein